MHERQLRFGLSPYPSLCWRLGQFLAKRNGQKHLNKKNMNGKMHYTTDRKQNQTNPLSPSVVVRGMSRRMGYLVRLSGKSLSFSRARLMTSLNSPILSSFSCSHITFFQSALSMVNRTTPRTPRKASSTATDFPDR